MYYLLVVKMTSMMPHFFQEAAGVVWALARTKVGRVGGGQYTSLPVSFSHLQDIIAISV